MIPGQLSQEYKQKGVFQKMKRPHPSWRKNSAQCFMVGKKSDTERDVKTYRRMVGRRGLLGGGPGAGGGGYLEGGKFYFLLVGIKKEGSFLWGTLYFVLVDRYPRPGFEVPNEGTSFDLVKPP